MRRREHGNDFNMGHAQNLQLRGWSDFAFPRSCGACRYSGFSAHPDLSVRTTLRRRSRGGIRPRTALRDGVSSLWIPPQAGLYERGPMHRPDRWNRVTQSLGLAASIYH